jgi:iron complex transport system substrate-binding protein
MTANPKRPSPHGTPSRLAGGLAAALLLLAGPLAAAEPIIDARGRSVEIADRSRVVSIGGTVTEILYALDAAAPIVAVDSTSLFPAEALRDHPNVGYMRALSAEGVLATAPSLILVSEAAGPPEVTDLLANSPVPTVFVDDAPTPDAVVERIRFVAAAMGLAGRGEALASRVEAGFADLAAVRARIAKPARVLFVLAVRDGHPLVAGRGTAADAIITLAGAENVAAGFEGYKPMGEEAIVEAAPEAVLMMNNAGAPPATDVLAMPSFAATPAGAGKRLVVMDGLSLLGFGPRTPEVARALARKLNPGEVP